MTALKIDFSGTKAAKFYADAKAKLDAVDLVEPTPPPPPPPAVEAPPKGEDVKPA